MELRDYQLRSIEAVRESMRQGNKRVCLYLSTGAGKTNVAIAIAKEARAKDKRVLFLCHRKDLVKQAWDRFVSYGITPGILQGANTWNPHDPIVVGSIQTFASRKKFGWNFEFDLVIADECHTCAGSKQYQELFRSWNNIPVIGLSATPFSKGLGREGMFQDIVAEVGIQDLIDQGFLVDCEIYAPAEPDLTGVKIVAGDYHPGDLGKAVDKGDLIGDIVHHWFKLANGRQTIVFATNIDHSKHIVEQFKAKGEVAVHCDCYMNENERDQIIADFKAGKIKILSNVSLFAEGFDCPATSCMILARPTRSLIRYIQMVGRVLRPAEGKQCALILDHSGSVARLGFPTDPLPLELDDGRPKPKDEKKKLEKKDIVCPKCTHVSKLMTCPKCGFTRKMQPKGIENQEGELQKIVKLTHENKQVIYSSLYAHAVMKGYNLGWCAHKFKKITGVWPRGLADVPGPMPAFVSNMLIHERIKFDRKKK